MRAGRAAAAMALVVACALVSPARGEELPACPYALGPWRELAFGGAGAVFAGIAWFAEKDARRLANADIARSTPGDVNRFDRPATDNWSPESMRMSDRFLTGSVILPLFLLTDAAPRRDVFVLGVMYLEMHFINTGLTGMVKATVRRKRPYVYNRDVPLEEKRSMDAAHSFYSGHTSSAFSSAVFFATIFSDYYPGSQWVIPVWCSSLLLASASSYFRYRAGAHFPTDMLSGAAMGGLTGYLVPALHRRGAGNVTVVPLAGFASGNGVEVRIGF